MSLEAALADYTKAVNANTGALATHSALLEKVIAGQTASLETIKGIEGTKPAGRPPGSKTKKETAEPTTAAAAPEKPAETKPAAPKTGAMSEDQAAKIRKLVGDWVGEIKEDGPKREARKAAIRKAWEPFSAQKVADVTAENFDEVFAATEAAIEAFGADTEEDSLL